MKSTDLSRLPNRALLVLCDSRQEDSFADVQTAFLSFLDHIGLAYAVHDLATGQPSAEMLRSYAAILMGQHNLGPSLSDETAQAIAAAVADGTGFIGGDAQIGYWPAALQHMTGVQVQDIQPAFQVECIDTDHFVSRWQHNPPSRCEHYCFSRPVALTWVTPTRPHVRVLLTSGGYPAMWVTRYGQGRVAQWALAPTMWRRDVLGHGEGPDDVLWRSMVWAALKPLPMLSMPPFSTAVVSDAIGSHDFAWVETLYRCGFPPNVGIFPDDIDSLSEIRGQSRFFDCAVAAMRRLAAGGMAEFAPHAATCNRAYLLFARPDGSDIPADELAQRFAALDKQFARYNVPWSRVAHPHYGQLGYNALPLLQERGVHFTLSELLPCEVCENDHRLWNGSPYNHPGFTIAPLPQSPNFFMITAGISYHETTIPTGPNTFSLRAESFQRANDWMYGRTRWQNQSPINDWDDMTQAAVRQVRLGLNALFFARPSTHEQTIAIIRLEEWDELWREIERRLRPYERWPALYSDIAVYARARYGAHLANARFDGGLLTCELEGSADVPLYLNVWNSPDDDDWPSYRYEKIAPFTKNKQITISMP